MNKLTKVAAGHYRDDATTVEYRKVPRKRLGRNGFRVAGWEATTGYTVVGFGLSLTDARKAVEGIESDR